MPAPSASSAEPLATASFDQTLRAHGIEPRDEFVLESASQGEMGEEAIGRLDTALAVPQKEPR